MESALSPLGEHLSCDLCRDALRDRIRNLVIQWSVVKVRIVSIDVEVHLTHSFFQRTI